MDHNHNHGHWFVFGALFSVVTFGALSFMELNARKTQPMGDDVVPGDPLLIVIPAVMLLVVALAANKWWHERG